MPGVSVTDISASGLAAERRRMEVVANNIANANTTRTAEGGPFRRQLVVFETAYGENLGREPIGALGGVEINGVVADDTELPRVHNPGHPDADADGMVTMPNVQMANEMVDLITASRAFEANLRALRAYRTMAESSLQLLRSS